MRTRTGAGAVTALLAIACLSACTPQSWEHDSAPAPTKTVRPAALDRFAGFFEDEPIPEGASAMRGSFGPAGQVGPQGWHNQNGAAAEYSVTVSCAGAEIVDFWFSEADAIDHRSAPTGSIRCPSSATTLLTTSTQSWIIELDSRGEAGAYLVTATPAV
ncbi:hypothetical protein [Microbacterium aurantiacum]|uniref:hypothetical protein n=1 Tax=Microbacterium aurantiacum TaxID=162393 RepID=UPI0011AEDBB3|nr:hypothetical protein [Microbacterium aurantiacum]